MSEREYQGLIRAYAGESSFPVTIRAFIPSRHRGIIVSRGCLTLTFLSGRKVRSYSSRVRFVFVSVKEAINRTQRTPRVLLLCFTFELLEPCLLRTERNVPCTPGGSWRDSRKSWRASRLSSAHLRCLGTCSKACPVAMHRRFALKRSSVQEF